MNQQLFHLAAFFYLVAFVVASPTASQVDDELLKDFQSQLDNVYDRLTPKERADLQNLAQVSLRSAQSDLATFGKELMKAHTGSTQGEDHFMEVHVQKPCRKLVEGLAEKIDPSSASRFLSTKLIVSNGRLFGGLLTYSICYSFLQGPDGKGL